MLKQRILTALILAPLALAGLFATNLTYFMLFTGAVICIGAWEWARLSQCRTLGQIIFPIFIGLMLFGAYNKPDLLKQALYFGLGWWVLALVLVLTYPKTSSLWRCPSKRLIMGAFVLVPTWAGLVYLRELNSLTLLYVLLIAWVADIGAYFTGRAWGKRKLAPKVSPGKSWEGVAGGLTGTAVLALITSFMLKFTLFEYGLFIAATLIVTLVSVLGDLTESMIKREAGMKDSSNLLPGHGGVMDRIDSLTAAIPIFAVFLIYAEAAKYFGFN